MKSARNPRVDQTLAGLGYGSRREVGHMIRAGRVTAGGIVLKDPAERIDPATLALDGEVLDHPQGILVRLHKPAGFVCSHKREEGDSVFDLLPDQWRDRNPQINTVGRLDRDTTGVLILTDDGDVIHRWTSPKARLEKVYTVQVDKPLEESLVEIFAAGTLQFSDEPRPCLPARLVLLDEKTAEVGLHEGKYHQIKRMFSHFGWEVTSLHRRLFGACSVEDLAPGAWADLTPDEVEGIEQK